ncbi:FHA domain-containing protein [Nocardioides sp. WS12]|uniref:FHA domain-containing protein n=1 Tax=Nocardioides sp. WS12 TaxID=2486272 RepID=UPI0015FCF21F|nr:FHA domain-containing protein [Nocardioides sp. WS12]
MTTYVAGDLATLVTDEGVVLAGADRLAEVAALAGRGLEPLTVVEVLSRGVLSELPDFAAVRIDRAEVRILVRGAFAVCVDGFRVEGTDAATWNEASAPLAAGSVVEVVPIGARSTGVALPLLGGVVHSGGVTWRPAVGTTTDPAPVAVEPVRPEPVRQPEPVAPEPVAPEPVAPEPVAPEPVAPEPVAPEPVAPAPAEPAHEHTVFRVPGAAAAPAAVAPATPPAPPVPVPVPAHAPPVPVPAHAPPMPPRYVPPTPQTGDISPEHDGRTITTAQMQAMRAGQPPATAMTPTHPGRPMVSLELSTGRVVQVRRRVLIGRSPRVQQVGGSANLPALVTVDDPYVSSTHLEVAAEGARITVTDTSTNGTLISRHGRPPVPLPPGVATEVTVGDVLTLSKGLTATVIPAQGR